jgi:hypothetical protein
MLRVPPERSPANEQAGRRIRPHLTDTDHDELGVRRQERECRPLAERQGIEVVAVHVDDDRSAAFPFAPVAAGARYFDD